MTDIYNTVWQSIQAGDYKLKEMLDRIGTLLANGYLSSAEGSDLIDEARRKADPEAEYAQDWQEPLNALASRVTALETWVTAHDTETGEGGTTTPADEWPEYVAPTGAHDAYYNGAKITYKGQRYVCIAPEGSACTWPPDVYPDMWELQED